MRNSDIRVFVKFSLQKLRGVPYNMCKRSVNVHCIDLFRYLKSDSVLPKLDGPPSASVLSSSIAAVKKEVEHMLEQSSEHHPCRHERISPIAASQIAIIYYTE